MFGMNPKRKPFFAPPEPYARPSGGIGGGMDQEAPMAPQAAQQPKKGGIFAPGGIGRHMAGSIGDMLLQQAEMQPLYGPQMQFQQQRAAQLADEQRKRSIGNEDWLAKEQWKRDNPTPQRDDTFTRTLEAAGIAPDSPEGIALYRQRAETLANPVQWIMGADGVPRPMPRGGAGPQVLGETLPEGWQIEGGGAGNGPGNFPGR